MRRYPAYCGREKIGETAEQGYLHCGPNGAGHFVKMVHNGIEYGIMAAYAEGLNILPWRQHWKEQRMGLTRKLLPFATQNITNLISTCGTLQSCGAAAA